MDKQYVIVDKDGQALRDELETEGLVLFEKEWDAADCIAYLIDDVYTNARRGLRVEEYNPNIHGV